MIPSIADMRRAAGLTQSEAAAALGVAQPSLAVWESGRGWPKIDRLPAMAALYGVEVGALVTAIIAGKEATDE